MRGRRRRGERLDEVYRGLRGAQQCAAPVGPSWPSPTRALPLRCAGFELRWQHVKTESDFLARLAPPPDIILADYTLPGSEVAELEARGREWIVQLPKP